MKQFGKLQITLATNPAESRVTLDGSELPVAALTVWARVGEPTVVELETIQLPGGEPYKFDGYLVSQEVYDATMRWQKEVG